MLSQRCLLFRTRNTKPVSDLPRVLSTLVPYRTLMKPNTEAALAKPSSQTRSGHGGNWSPNSHIPPSARVSRIGEEPRMHASDFRLSSVCRRFALHRIPPSRSIMTDPRCLAACEGCRQNREAKLSQDMDFTTYSDKTVHLYGEIILNVDLLVRFQIHLAILLRHLQGASPSTVLTP